MTCHGEGDAKSKGIAIDIKAIKSKCYMGGADADVLKCR